MLVRRTAIAAAIVAAPLAFAAPAWAQPTDISCSPCTWEDATANGPWEPAFAGAPWEPLFANAPWESITANGPWESITKNGPWESATANGPWEKVFPPAE
jgi:hypothetical protein